MEWARQKKVITYGLGNTVYDMIEYVKTRFDVIGCSDSNPEKEIVARELGFTYVEPEKIAEKEYDYILIVSVYDDEISRQLIEQTGLPAEKVLRRTQWCRMMFQCSFGELNPDKTFYVLSHPIHLRDGLFSYLFAFLEQMDYLYSNGFIPVVDMQSFWSQYLDEDKIGIENAWEYYYEPLSDYTLDEIYKSKNVILGYDDNCYKGNYDKKYNIRRMSELNQQYVRYNCKTISVIEDACRKYLDNNKKTLGVLFRGTDMSSLKLKNHPVQPTVYEMVDLIHQYMKKWECERIFLSTEDASAVRIFQEEFGDILVYTDQRRFGDTGKVWLANINFDRQDDKYYRGLEYITTIELLARCDCLLAGICTGSICAEILNNGKYKHIKMIDKGEYC